MSHTRPEDQQAQHRLEVARQNATQKRAYNSNGTRTTLTEEFRRRTTKEPYPWQLDVSEALILGLDCIVLAGTGAGKTMPFIMPLFVYPKKCVIIVCPLIELQENQVRVHHH